MQAVIYQDVSSNSQQQIKLTRANLISKIPLHGRTYLLDPAFNYLFRVLNEYVYIKIPGRKQNLASLIVPPTSLYPSMVKINKTRALKNIVECPSDIYE
jgi:hypothetical protein